MKSRDFRKLAFRADSYNRRVISGRPGQVNCGCKIPNLDYHIALRFMYYNMGWVHQTISVTVAMEARVSNHLLEVGAIPSNSDSNERGADAEGDSS